MTHQSSDTQGNILRGYPHEHAAYLFATIDNRARTAELIDKEMIGQIQTATDWHRPGPESTLNIAFTYDGLAALDIDVSAFRAMDDFSEGMQARAGEHLGDKGSNAPDNWELRDVKPHVLFTMYARDTTVLGTRLNWLRGKLARGGLTEVYCQEAASLGGRREHFGFEDGFSQPAVEGSGGHARGEGVCMPWIGWRNVPLRRLMVWHKLRVGEFLLGHRDEDDDVPGAEAELLRNGTFMVWRKLEQDVGGFNAWVRQEAGDAVSAQDRLKAQIVGRWQNGTSLVRAPNAQPYTSAKPKRPNNKFVYSADPDGVKCPLGAHVRRAYPRDGLGWQTQRTRRSRIIRRGMPYGPPWDATHPDDHERGLIFVCFNASISRQFEQIQRNWLMDGDTFGLAAERDFLTAGLDGGGQTVKMAVRAGREQPPLFVTRTRQFVTVLGGYYLFVPGITALKDISRPR